MRINLKNQQKINMDKDELEEVDTFTYLGSEVTTDGGAEKDVKIRIGKASGAFKMLNNKWKSNH